jgi:hypothetical protein
VLNVLDSRGRMRPTKKRRSGYRPDPNVLDSSGRMKPKRRRRSGIELEEESAKPKLQPPPLLLRHSHLTLHLHCLPMT